MKKLIIFPDIHGRTFWKIVFEKYKDNENYSFIFLGDYLDPYGFEGITEKMALDNFKEICELTFDHPRVIRLIGNHDLHYFSEFKHGWGCRRNNKDFDEISKMFEENIDKFKFAHEETINGKRYIFTHAGITNGWVNAVSEYSKQGRKYGDLDLSKYHNPEDLWNIDYLNEFLKTKSGRYLASLVGRERGGRFPSGSFVWADIHEHTNTLPWDSKDIYEAKNIYQIFGHSLAYPDYEDLDQYYIGEELSMLDSRRAFILDLENGKIEELKF